MLLLRAGEQASFNWKPDSTIPVLFIHFHDYDGEPGTDSGLHGSIFCPGDSWLASGRYPDGFADKRCFYRFINLGTCIGNHGLSIQRKYQKQSVQNTEWHIRDHCVLFRTHSRAYDADLKKLHFLVARIFFERILLHSK